VNRPLILLTNDDGIDSAGLWAAVAAVLPLGEVLVVAPDRQWSGAGRCIPHTVTGAYRREDRIVGGRTVTSYAVDASPALAVEHGLLEFSDRQPSLIVSGVNFGANLSVDVTISGTVGAALEGSAFGIPSLAVSLEMDPDYYLTGDADADYSAAEAYVRRFAGAVLRHGMPYGIDVLNLNLPSDATPQRPWRRTYLSRRRYFDPVRPVRTSDSGRPRYRIIADPAQTEPGSDIHVLLVERLVSLTPLSLDMSAGVSDFALDEMLTAELAAYQAFPERMTFPSQLDTRPWVATDA